jgi:hypothetical protein
MVDERMRAHKMQFSEKEGMHLNITRAGLQHRANCACGWKQFGTKKIVRSEAVRHLERIERQLGLA